MVLHKIKKNKIGFYQSKFDEIVEEDEDDEESEDRRIEIGGSQAD